MKLSGLRAATGLAAGGVIFASIVLGMADAMAQEAKTDGLVPWVFACGANGTDTPLQCRMTQELFSTENRQRVLAITVAAAQNNAADFEMTLALPHGALLPPGLSLKIDEQEAVVVPIESSNAAGVYARVPLEGDLGNAVRRGIKMVIGVTNRAGNQVQIPVSLTGFSAALKRLAVIK